MVWATREELLDKLFFLAVSGDGGYLLVVATPSVTDYIVYRPHFYQVFLFDISQVCNATKYPAWDAKTRPTTQSRTFRLAHRELRTNEVLVVTEFFEL